MEEPSTSSRWWPRAIRASERGRFAFLLGVGTLIHLAQTVGLAGSEALFLARLGAGRLPATFVLASAATVAASLLYAQRVGRARNDAVFFELFLLGAVAVIAGGISASLGWRAAPVVLLCLFFSAQAVLLSHFWTFSGDLFDTLAAKRVAPLFAVGMSVGGALGGALAVSISAWFSPSLLIFLWGSGLAAAALLVGARRASLRRWCVLEIEEEDETSVTGLGVALRYLGARSLGRWLVISSLAMVLALFVAQYLYSDVFARSFPDEARLAAFLGLFLAVTNLAEIGVELAVTPRLIRRVGVATTNLAHPCLVMLSFLALALDFRLPAAIATRVTREPLENALAGPVRNLIYNAVPVRLRARVRALLEGLVAYSGMFVAGGVLLLVGSLDSIWLCLVGGGLAGLYLVANARVRRAYLHALVVEIRAGALELTELSADIGQRELSELSELWDRLLAETDDRPSPLLRELAPLLAARGFQGSVRRGLFHRHAVVREISLVAMANGNEPVPQAFWWRGLEDPEARVRAAAIEHLPPEIAAGEEARARLRHRLRDPTAGIRAQAALRLEEAGLPVLSEMARSSAAEEALAALSRLPASLRALARDRIHDTDPRVRAAALERWTRDAPLDALDLEALTGELAHADARVRRAAVGALAHLRSPAATRALALGLQDTVHEVRSAAVEVLAERGAMGIEAVSPLLKSGSQASVEAVHQVLGRAGGPHAKALLTSEYERHVRSAWLARLALEVLPAAEAPVPMRFLRLAYADAGAASLRLALRSLAWLEEVHVVRRIERALRFASRRARADALELLSNLGPREVSARLVLFLEPGPLGEKLRNLEGFVTPPRDGADAVACARQNPSRWLRWAVSVLSTASGGVPEEEAKMARLLFLRQIPLFSQLSLEQLEAVERISRTVDYVSKEVIVREGTPGEELYLLETGEVDVFRGYGTARQLRLNSLGPGDYFGEMAVLDGALRSATVVARSEARLLVLDGNRFRELVHERPEMAFEIFRVLTERLRAAEGRLSQRAPSTAPASSS